MQAFKLNLRIIWKSLPTLAIYLIVFVGISIMVANATASEPVVPDLFEPTKLDAAWFSDEDTALTRGLRQELEKTVVFHDLADDQAQLADALYWQDLQYIVRIPAGFTAAVLAGEDVTIGRTAQADSYFSVYTDMAVESYLDTARLYVKHGGELSAEMLAERVASDMAQTVDISFYGKTTAPTVYAQYFYNFMAYSILAILIFGMGSLMVTYKDPELKRRNAASPLPLRSQALGFVLANLLFGLGTWLAFVVASVLLDWENAGTVQTRWFIVNSLVFCFAASALSYMIGSIIKKANVIDAVSNVVSLGTAFISGVFVPQEFLASSVLVLARFTPVYWYVQANNRIATISDFDPSAIWSITQPMLIVFGFAVLFVVVSLIAMRKNRYEY